MAELDARIIAKASGTSGEAPQAADLEVAELAVNTADGKLFTKHTDGSVVTISGSGGGAVDSLADIGDVQDYLAQATPGQWDDEVIIYNSGANYFPSVNGEWGLAVGTTAGTGLLFVKATDSLGSSFSTLLDAAILNPTAYSFTIQVNGGAQTAVIPVTNVGLNASKQNYRIDFNTSDLDPAAYNADGYSYSSPSTSPYGPYSNTLVLDLRLTADFNPSVSDGQVLTWVDANSRWEPATPSGGGGAVDSVNGKTGVVSLGVQDMDDFALNTAPPQGALIRSPISSFTTYVWAEDGSWAWTNSTQQQISYFAQDGTDERSVFAGWANGHVISWTQNDVELGRGELTLLVVDEGSGLERVTWTLVNGTITQPPSTTDDIVILNESLLGGMVEVALAEGDILQWDANEGTFKPAQLPASLTIDDVRLDAETTTFAYDVEGNLESTTGTEIQKSFTYDAGGVLQTVTTTSNGTSKIKTFSYDLDGNLSSVTVT